MSDYCYINILNEGNIPWLREKGPLFGYKISAGMLNIIRRDSRINFVVLTSREEGEKAKKEYYAKKEMKKLLEEKPVVNNIPVKDEDVNEDDNDSEIDKVLEEVGEMPEKPEVVFVQPVVANKTDVLNSEIRKYTEEELLEMTKAQMKIILRERGHTSGPYSGKYHDTVEILIRKVLATQ